MWKKKKKDNDKADMKHFIPRKRITSNSTSTNMKSVKTIHRDAKTIIWTVI